MHRCSRNYGGGMLPSSLPLTKLYSVTFRGIQIPWNTISRRFVERLLNSANDSSAIISTPYLQISNGLDRNIEVKKPLQYYLFTTRQRTVVSWKFIIARQTCPVVPLRWQTLEVKVSISPAGICLFRNRQVNFSAYAEEGANSAQETY